MAQRARGYSVKWQGPVRGYTVRFRHHGQRYHLSTGVKARGAKSTAEEAAREIYLETVTGRRSSNQSAPPTTTDLVEVTAQWIESLSLRPKTRQCYTDYTGLWVERWKTLREMSAEVERYFARRLKAARGKTVANEASAMRQFFEWCVTETHLAVAPTVPRVSKKGGTPYHIAGKSIRRRVAAPEFSPAEISRLLAALPTHANRDGWPIRARFVVAFETTLRPRTLDLLRVPDHYTKGAQSLLLPDSVDKEQFGREIPLSDKARKALDSVCPEVGLIFGAHRYDPYIREAAAKALPAHKAALICGQHLRSAGITHLLDQGAPLTAAMWMAGHSQPGTTAGYVRASLRAAQAFFRDTARDTKKRKQRKRA